MKEGTKFKFKSDYLFKTSLGDIENLGNQELEITGRSNEYFYCRTLAGETYLLSNLNKQLNNVEFIR